MRAKYAMIFAASMLAGAAHAHHVEDAVYNMNVLAVYITVVYAIALATYYISGRAVKK